MQQENQANVADEQTVPPYAKTLGFAMIQASGSAELPEDVQAELAKIIGDMQKIDPNQVESVVAVIRVKAEPDENGPGFRLMVAATGPQDVVLGSSLMLNEYLVQAEGGPGAMMAKVAETMSRLTGQAMQELNIPDGEGCMAENACQGCEHDSSCGKQSAEVIPLNNHKHSGDTAETPTANVADGNTTVH